VSERKKIGELRAAKTLTVDYESTAQAARKRKEEKLLDVMDSVVRKSHTRT